MNIKSLLIDKDRSLPGREEVIKISPNHFVNDNRILEPFPDGIIFADFGLGCFWGAERIFGLKMVFIQLLLVIWAVIQRIRPMRRFALG